MGTTFRDLTINQKTISIILTVITGLVGAWWYESGQEIWSWLSFIFTAAFIIFAMFLFMLAESWLKNKLTKK